jgi:acetyl-CoA carboxylase carboxyl transferase subunit alpha
VKKFEAGSALKLTAPARLKGGIIDKISREPVGGAHTDPAGAALAVDKSLSRCLREVSALDAEARLARRYEKFRNIGRVGVDFVDEGA